MERYRHPKGGLIEVICGPMFSGKTEELIRRLRRAQIAKQSVMVFKPEIDKRYDENQVVSHSEQRIMSLPVRNVSDMSAHLSKLLPGVDVIGIDEAQFFDIDLVNFVEDLAEQNLRVVVAGLDQDYQGKPFGPLPNLLAISDLITKQYAVCMQCGAPASKTQRLRPTGDLIMVGAQDAYEARCRRCHVKGANE